MWKENVFNLLGSLQHIYHFEIRERATELGYTIISKRIVIGITATEVTILCGGKWLEGPNYLPSEVWKHLQKKLILLKAAPIFLKMHVGSVEVGKYPSSNSTKEEERFCTDSQPVWPVRIYFENISIFIIQWILLNT